MHWVRILNPLAKIISSFGVLMLMPAFVAAVTDDGMILVYIMCGSGTILFGVAAAYATRDYQEDLHTRHGFILVCLIWTLLPFFASLPLITALPGLTFTLGYFEAASGLTATGATVLSGLDGLPPSINFWRGEMVWIGGMGLIVLATAILPLLGVGGSASFQTEMPGPIKDNRLTPNLSQTAKALWTVYTSLTVICTAAYFLAGMDLLDAVIHAFTTMGLGGFSSHDAGFGYFDSVAVEIVAIVFMIIAGMNFASHYLAWRSRSVRLYFYNTEWRAYIMLLGLGVAVVFAFLMYNEVYESPQEGLRYAAFNAVSVITTTGYANTDYSLWPIFAPMLLLVMANFTSCSGSTGGGIKLIRALIVLKQADSERQKLVRPSSFYTNKIGFMLPQKILVSVLFFIIAYFTFAFVLMLFLMATGLDFITAFSASAASISNTGPGLGEVGPASTFGGLTDTQIWACAIAMLFGRLELMSFVVVLHYDFWKY